MTNHHCCVPGCAADSRKDTSTDKYKFLRGVSFHGFPREAKLRRLWLELIQRPDFDPSRYARICSLHFVGRRGPTQTHPCPTLFMYNNFTGQVSEDLSARIEALRNARHLPNSVTSFSPRAPPSMPHPASVMSSSPSLTSPSPSLMSLSPTVRSQSASVRSPSASVRSPSVSVRSPSASMSAASPTGTSAAGSATASSKSPPSNMKVMTVKGKPGDTIILDGKEIKLSQLMSGPQVKLFKTASGAPATSFPISRSTARNINSNNTPGNNTPGNSSNKSPGSTPSAASSAGSSSEGNNKRGDGNNPYQFINENTDMMWQMGPYPADTSSVQHQLELAGTGTWKLEKDDEYKKQGASSGKRKREEPEEQEEEEEEEEEEEGSSEEEEEEDGDEEEEEEGNDFEEAEAQTNIKKSKKESNGRAVVIQDGMQVPASVMDQINRPPLEFETDEVKKYRERLILRGPHHNYMPKARCKYCDLFFANIRSLFDHIYRHTDRPYQCVECGEMFEKAEAMEDHIEMHKIREVEMEGLYRVAGVKRRYLCCPLVGCDWSLRTEHIRDFALHMRRHDSANCVLCGEGLHGASETFFTKHLKKHVGFITKMRCPLCPESAKQGQVHKNLMQQHIQDVHKVDKLWSCYHCEDEKPINTFTQLDLHLLKAHSSNPYECQYCGAAYPSLFSLKSHARKHHQRGREHDQKYQWIAVIRSIHNGPTLPSRRSKKRKEVPMMPIMGDRLFPPMTPQVVNLFHKQQQQQKEQKSVAVPLPAMAANNILAALGKGKISVPTEITGSAAIQMMNLIQAQTGENQGLPQPSSSKPMPKLLPRPNFQPAPAAAPAPAAEANPDKPKMRPPSAKMLAAAAKRQAEAAARQMQQMQQAAAAAAAASALPPSRPAPPPKPAPPKPAAPSHAAPPPPKQPKMIERKYRPQKVFIPQKDGTLVSKTVLLPVEELEDDEPVAGIPVDSDKSNDSTPGGGADVSDLVGLSSVYPTPHKMEPAAQETPPPSSRSATGPSDISLDNSVLESLGISSQDLELGPVTETDESLGFTITEVRGDIDFGALPDDGSNDKESEVGANSLQEDKNERAAIKIRCPFKDCREEFDDAVGFWRRHYLKLHFKRSDMYEYMCRDCGELVYSWDWPPQDHPCANPRWACICADCGDVFENMKNKNAHYPDCLTFQKYTPPPGARSATTVITAHTCLYCTTGLKSAADLCSHLRVSHVSRRFNSLIIHCSLCAHYPTFSHTDKLWEHYKTCHKAWWMAQPAWLCTKCGEAHESEYDLTKHVVYTHAQNIAPSFLCNKCPFVFATSTLYNMHKEVAHKSGK